MQTECLVAGRSDLRLQVTVRFLQRIGPTGSEVVEREVASDAMPLAELANEGVALPIQFLNLTGWVTFAAREIETLRRVHRVLVRIVNTTPVAEPARATRDDMFPSSFLSTHTILNAYLGRFRRCSSRRRPGSRWP
jgi:hypothetical protein